MEYASSRALTRCRFNINPRSAIASQLQYPRRSISAINPKLVDEAPELNSLNQIRTLPSTSNSKRGPDKAPEINGADEVHSIPSRPRPARPSEYLPRSPLFEKKYVEPKQRKNRPDATYLEPLSDNPWALALATPVRMCALTGTRMPRALLGEWGLVRKPDTEQNYVLPVDLLKEALQQTKVTREAAAETPDATDRQDNESSSLNDVPSDDIMDLLKESPEQGAAIPNAAILEQTQESTPSNRTVGRHVVFRMVNLLPTFQLLSEPLAFNTSRKPAVSRLIPFRWKHPQGPITAREEKEMVWIEDMPEYLLQKMRNDLVKKLKQACQPTYDPSARTDRIDFDNKLAEAWKKSHEPGSWNGVWTILEAQRNPGVMPAKFLKDMRSIDDMACGAVLLLGRSQPSSITDETITHPQTQTQVPVFDLSAMLGEADLTRLRETEPLHFENESLFFRPVDPVGHEAMLVLWKLQRFLTKDLKLAEIEAEW
ncbi:hypothetical protein N7495_003254 [Penicillium taxi]|uniref:uncharacterized protein n=1 Tax=Penicillium taxi TaxID=168475 RepID=UPI002544ED55|nr:uncharacterized protein N7495_003254 [Penicillium taxi]KAJ5902726.1 hypothetical protein N7495_003254 [Penicillium taxi]